MTALPRLLLIPPVGGSTALWADLHARLAPRFRVIAHEHPGELLPPPTIRALARAAARAVEQGAGEAVHVFGESVGGMVAVWLAADFPALVRTLTVASTPLHAGLPGRWRRASQVGRCFARPAHDLQPCLARRILTPSFRAANPELTAHYEALVSDLPPRRAHTLALLAASAGYDGRDAAPRIRCPAQVVAGEEDGLVPVAAQQEFARAIPGAAFHRVRWGHAVSLQQPAELVTLISAIAARG